MHEIPHAVLSEQFQKQLEGRRVRTAVFLTFRFEPDFFEQEVLPAILPDAAVSHVPQIRLLQLEDALSRAIDNIAVYYDRAGLVANGGSAKLDARRIPTHHPTGIFHPKNVFLLTEAVQPDGHGHRDRSLVVAAMSANLTQAGWWRNVEACHIEHLFEGDPCSFKRELLQLIRRTKAASPPGTDHTAIDSIHAFVSGLDQRKQKSVDGVLHPRLYVSEETVCDFLEQNIGGIAEGICLEVISPYFDKNDSAPLRAVCERFSPVEVRVFLPRDTDESALCDEAFYKAARAIDNVRFGRLPYDVVRAGKTEKAGQRTVHAKVYRFFDPRRRYEALLVGSVNLTQSAHQKGGNLETAFLIETNPKRVPDWWLEADNRKPAKFAGSEPEEGEGAVTYLSIRYDWDSGNGSAYWDAPSKSGGLAIKAQGAPLFALPGLPPREWVRVPDAALKTLGRILESTSYLEVSENGGPDAIILVQEEGMAHKPSLLFTLSAADILRYWSLLTQDQRDAFIEERFAEIADFTDVIGGTTPKLGRFEKSMFDTFAGIYHGFHAMERSAVAAIKVGSPGTELEFAL